ncbi:MAG: LysM peptidoglycan-binding domain-containing protein [Candidatus Eiseniibacteriota bacterium]
MRLWVAAWGAALLLAAGGCGKPVLRLADASLGDYYTEKEYQKLTDEQRQEYCQELADQKETFESGIADSHEALDALQLGTPTRRAEIDSLQNLASRLEARVAEAGAPRGPRESASGRGASDKGASGTASAPSDRAETYVVKKGDSLWRISGLTETLGRSAEWSRLFEANRGRIRNPDRIYPGQELHIPR